MVELQVNNDYMSLNDTCLRENVSKCYCIVTKRAYVIVLVCVWEDKTMKCIAFCFLLYFVNPNKFPFFFVCLIVTTIHLHSLLLLLRLVL